VCLDSERTPHSKGQPWIFFYLFLNVWQWAAYLFSAAAPVFWIALLNQGQKIKDSQKWRGAWFISR
jgi:hypothetical protein